MHIKQPHSIQAFHRTPGVKVATSTRGNYTRLKRLNTSKQQQNHCNLQQTLQRVHKSPNLKLQKPNQMGKPQLCNQASEATNNIQQTMKLLKLLFH